MQEKMGKNIWMVNTTELQSRHSIGIYINWMIKNKFEQQCVLLNSLLNQGELAYHCSYIGLNDVEINSSYLSSE